MATSGSYDFTMTRDDCISEALAQLGVLGEGESPTAAQLTADSFTLNLMLKAWQNDEITKNLVKRFFVFLEKDVREYPLDFVNTSGTNAAFDFYYDTTAADYTDGETSLTVTTGVGAADSDTILVVGDEGTFLDGAIDSGGGTTSLTVEDLDGDAESGQGYFAYTSKIRRPIDLYWANICTLGSDVGKEDSVLDYNRQPIRIAEQRDFINFPDPATSSQPNACWYEETWPGAVLHVWPTPNVSTQFLEIWGQFSIDDMDSASDNFLLPTNWYLAVAFGLAKWLIPKYGTSEKRAKEIKALAEEAYDMAASHETGDYIQLDPRRRRR